MGSSGSGSFTDYSGAGNKSTEGGGSSGGSSGDNKCSKAFSVSLEDVALYAFFLNTRTVPRVGTALNLTLGARVIACDAAGIQVGAVPTSHNYLAGCLNAGFSYTGVVTYSSLTPVQRVDVDFIAV